MANASHEFSIYRSHANILSKKATHIKFWETEDKEARLILNDEVINVRKKI